MPAIKYSEIKMAVDSLVEDDSYSAINYYAKIHDSVRLEPYSVIEQEVEIGEGSIIGPFVQIRGPTKIGKNCRIGGGCTLEGHGIEIGDNVHIGTKSTIAWSTQVGNNSFLGDGLITSNDKVMTWGTGLPFEPEIITIKEYVRIGVGVVLLPGLTLNEFSVIGAGSVVTRDTGVGGIYYGVPAKLMGENKWRPHPT